MITLIFSNDKFKFHPKEDPIIHRRQDRLRSSKVDIRQLDIFSMAIGLRPAKVILYEPKNFNDSLELFKYKQWIRQRVFSLGYTNISFTYVRNSSVVFSGNHNDFAEFIKGGI